jgi:hypothetical protein
MVALALANVYARAGFPDPPSRGHRLVSLCTKSVYVAVVSIILGQALLFANVHVLEYGAGTWLVTHGFVLTYEEPKMRATFGDEYRDFSANVPRWIPRVTPWSAPH